MNISHFPGNGLAAWLLAVLGRALSSPPGRYPAGQDRVQIHKEGEGDGENKEEEWA